MIRCVNRQWALQKREKKYAPGAAFCLLMGTLPINFGLLGGNGNILKLEMTTKLKDKQTLIATVRDLLRTFATFPAPLLSHCRLPLRPRVRLELSMIVDNSIGLIFQPNEIYIKSVSFKNKSMLSFYLQCRQIFCISLILWGWGETDTLKKPEVENLVALSL
jgi:hypothetical protein